MEVITDQVDGKQVAIGLFLSDKRICKTEVHEYDGHVHLYIGVDEDKKPVAVSVVHPPE